MERIKVSDIPDLVGQLFVVGIKYGQDGTNVAMSVAVRTKDGRFLSKL